MTDILQRIERALCCPRGCSGGPSDDGHCIAYQCESAALAVLDTLKRAGLQAIADARREMP